MELETVGGGAEAEGLIGAGDRARERDSAGRQLEVVLVPAEDLQAARQPGKDRVVVGRIRQEDIVEAELWAAACDDTAKRAREELSAEADAEER